MKSFRHILFLSLSLFILIGCTSETEQKVAKSIDEPLKNSVVEEKEATERTITISAIGDMLIHSSVYEDAETDGVYNFYPMLKNVAPYLSEATITFANQETMIGGVEHGLSNYPSFNSPVEAGEVLKEVGVDIVSIANNHTLDRGEAVIQSSINHWNEMEMPYVGAYTNQEDKGEIRVIDTEEGISVAFLAYTYGTNGIPVPEGKEYLVNLIDQENIKEEIKRAKEVADVIMLSLHFGTEYEPYPNDEQKELAQFAADEGVHAVIGHHPHVLQPIEWVEGIEGNETLVIYSLGNFLSGQDKIPRQIGGMINFTVKQTIANNEIEITDPKFLPTFVSYEDDANYHVWPMHEVTDEHLQNAKEHYKKTTNHISEWLPDIQIITDKDELIYEEN